MDTATTAAGTQAEIVTSIRARIQSDLGRSHQLSAKLLDWHEMDFNDFRDEVARALRTEIPVRERAQWEAYLAENTAKIRALTAGIEAAECEIDRLVYAAFELTQEEIAIIEATFSGRA